MMDKGFDELNLTIAFKYPLEQIPARDLCKTIMHCEEAVHTSEWYEIVAVKNELNLPNYVFDAMSARLDMFKGQMVQVEYAEKGSIVIGAMVAAAALWVLEKTIGEVMVEAWKETEMRKNLKNFLLSRVGWKKEQLAMEIKKRIEGDDELSLEVKFDITSDEESPSVVFVYVIPQHERIKAPKRVDFNFW